MGDACRCEGSGPSISEVIMSPGVPIFLAQDEMIAKGVYPFPTERAGIDPAIRKHRQAEPESAKTAEVSVRQGGIFGATGCN